MYIYFEWRINDQVCTIVWFHYTIAWDVKTKAINETTLSNVSLLITTQVINQKIIYWKQVKKLCYDGRLVERRSALDLSCAGNCFEMLINLTSFTTFVLRNESIQTVFSGSLSFLQSIYYTVCFTKSQRKVSTKL